MKLRESILIPAAPERIWSTLADPQTWPDWNFKVRSVRRSHRGPALAGEQFHAVFKLGSRETPSEVQVVVSEPPTRLALRQHYQSDLRARSIEIVFQLEPADDGARLTQTVDLARAGIPWPLRLLIGLIHRYGRPSGPSALDGLRGRLAAGAQGHRQSR